MLAGDVRREAIGRHLLPAKPAEGLAGRDVDALHSNSMSGSLFARQAHGEPKLLSSAYISTGVGLRIEATAALPVPYPFFSRHLL